MLTFALAAALAVAPAPGERPLDLVVLRDGTRIAGRIVAEDEHALVVRVGSKDQHVARAETSEVRSRLASWREAFDRWGRLDEEDATRIADIGTYAQRMGLAEEARVFALRAISVDPENVPARELLGHEKKEKGWFLRENGRRWSWKDRVERSRSWRDAWQLESTHWSLRTNLDLRQAVDAILDLENAYAIYFAELAPIVGARHVDRVLAAQIHADDGSYPELSGGRAFYDSAARVLVINASNGFDRGLMVHEVVHQLIDETAVQVRGGRGAIAPWLDEGLADWFRATTDGPPGRLRFDGSRIDSRAVRTHAHARETYRLSRVLTFDVGEYHATSRQDLKYAQSYTFVHFLVAGDGGRYRGAFDDYLRSSWKGQGSPTDLQKCLGASLDTIEKAWTAWVRERAR